MRKDSHPNDRKDSGRQYLHRQCSVGVWHLVLTVRMAFSLQGVNVLKHNPPVELPGDRSKYRGDDTEEKPAHVTAQHPQTL